MPESQVSALKQNVHRRQAHLPHLHLYFILELCVILSTEHMEQRMQQENVQGINHSVSTYLYSYSTIYV